MSGASPLTDFDWALRTFIYRSFAESGRAPVLGAMAAAAGGTEHQVRSSLQRLFEAHEIAPTSNGDGVWMANPFSAVPTDYVVETPDMTCYANCAWDALGIPSALKREGVVRSRCEQSREPLVLHVGLDGPVASDWLFHCLVPAAQWWDDIVFT